MNTINLDGKTVTFHTYPQAPGVYHVAIDGEHAGTLQVIEIGRDKRGRFSAVWRARAVGSPKPESALFYNVDDAINHIVQQYA